MKLDSLSVDHFARDAYQDPEIQDTGGEDILITGRNRTGKTLTLNSIIYSLLGSNETLDLNPGRSNKVDIGLNNGVEIHRGSPKNKFTSEDEEFEGKEATSRIQDFVDTEVVRNFFFHSRPSNLPLNRLSKSERIELIRKVTDEGSAEKINKLEEAKKDLDHLIEKYDSTVRRNKETLTEAENTIESLDRRKNQFNKLLELREDGKLENLVEKLAEGEEKSEEISGQLQELLKRKTSINEQIRQLVNRKKELERYEDKRVKEIIAQATNDLVCPVCSEESHEKRVPTNTAETRIDNGRCPFCAQKEDLRSLKENIRDKVEGNSEQIETYQEKIDELKEEKSEIKEKLDELKGEDEDFEDVDGFVERTIRNNDYSLESVLQEAEENLEEIQENLEDQKESIESLKGDIEKQKEKVDIYEAARSGIKNKIDELEQDSYSEDVAKFEEEMLEILQEMDQDLIEDLLITEDGDIQFPGGVDEVDERNYSEPGFLSEAEVILSNIAFSIALMNISHESDVVEFKTLVMDEPFSELDDDLTSSVLDYLKDSDIQLVLLSAQDFNGNFDQENVFKLEKASIQSSLERFNDD